MSDKERLTLDDIDAELDDLRLELERQLERLIGQSTTKSSTTRSCNDGCVIVERILQGIDSDYDDCDRDYMEKRHSIELTQYECYRQIKDGDYGHMNYAVMAYAAKHGHLDCIKTLFETTEVMWHSDVADVAAENGHLECLKYIVEVMGDVDLHLDKSVKCDKCIQYIKTRL